MAKRKPKCLQSLMEMHTPDYWKGRGMYSKTHIKQSTRRRVSSTDPITPILLDDPQQPQSPPPSDLPEGRVYSAVPGGERESAVKHKSPSGTKGQRGSRKTIKGRGGHGSRASHKGG